MRVRKEVEIEIVSPILLARLFVAGLFIAPFGLGLELSSGRSFLPAIAAIVVALGFLILVGRSNAGSIASMAVLAVGLALGAESGFDYGTCPSARFSAGAIDKAHRYLRSLPRPHTKVFMWFEKDESVPVRHPRCSAASARVNLADFGRSLAMTGFQFLSPQEPPSLDQLPNFDLERLAAIDGIIVHLTSDGSRVQRLVERFERNGISLHLTRRKDITFGALTVPMYVFNIRPPTQ